MDRLRGILKQLRALVRRDAVERELEEELRFHLEREAERLVREEGLEPDAARRRARVAFGGVEQTKERVREARWTRWLEDVGKDLRFALRTFARRPGVVAAAVATLAVGIGAGVVIYDAGRALATDAVPFPDPDRLVTVRLRGDRGFGESPLLREFREWEAAAARVLTLGAYTLGERFVGDGARTYRVAGARVSGGFFDALGVAPLLGRTLSAGDAAPGGEPVAVVTQRLWEGRFGGDPGIVGRTLRIDGRVHTVVGVVPNGSQYPPGADLWTPLAAASDGAASGGTASLRVGVIGRLGTEATAEAARAALATIQRGLDRERPAGERGRRVTVLPLSGRPDGADRIALILLQCAVLVLVLIASTNAAGLMLTRAVERRQELAVRASMGAGRGRIVRQLVVESALLAAVAGALGLFVAYAGIAALRNAVPAATTRNMLGWERLGLDAHAVAFAFALTGLAAIVAGVVPALRAVRGDLTVHLREGAPTTTQGRRGRRLARLILSGEVALALTLLLIAGLLTRSLLGLVTADPGFDARGVLAVGWALPPDRYDGTESVARFQEPLLERLGGVPGVRSAGFVSNLPMSRTGWRKPYRVQGSDPGAEPPSANWRPITPEYLPTLGIALRAGRGFTRADGAAAPRVAIVGEALARRHWPGGGSPLGRRLEVDGEVWTVVGVVEDVHEFGVDRSTGATIYVPQAQSPTRAGFLAVRTAGDPAVLAPRIRREIWSLDPDIALGEVRTLRGMVRDFYAVERLTAVLVGVFASVALLITVISLYTLVAHAVARRRREIGIRLALGARPRRILLGAMAQGVVSVGVGIAAGLLLSAGAAQALRALLYGIRPLDPLVFALVPGAVLAVSVLASYVPASDAIAVDPTEALRGG